LLALQAGPKEFETYVRETRSSLVESRELESPPFLSDAS
jgi:hypothetical protein